MTIRTVSTTLVLGFALLLFAPRARAEEGSSIEEQVKQKLQEILRLMQENEQVLLRASTGAGGDARRVEVDVPEPSGRGGAQGGTSPKGDGEAGAPKGDGEAGAPKGEELARKMRELIEGQRQHGGKIPGEMGKLLKMIPARPGGKGQGEPKDGKGEGSKEEQEARDARKKLEQAGKTDKDEPKSGERSPQDPARRMPKGGEPEDVKPDGSRREDGMPAWFLSLPPEIRDAMSGGRAEDVPPRYRHLIERYHLWLQRNKR